MNRKLLQGMMLLLAVMGPAQADKIYRWTDADGNVHYGSKPGNKSAVRVNIRNKKPATPASTATRHNRKVRQRRLLHSFEQDRRLRQQREEKLQRQQQQAQARCRYYTKLLENYSKSSYLYTKNPDGTRRIYTKEERRSAETAAQANKERWCRAAGR